MLDALKVLLVEDNPADAELIRDGLTVEDGLAIEHAVTLQETLQRLDEETFDVVLLDLTLPDSQGVETVRRTKENAGAVPVIVLTGTDDRERALEALRTGADDYLVKGREQNDAIIRAVRYAVERNQLARQLDDAYAKLAARNVEDIADQGFGLAEQTLELLRPDYRVQIQRYVDALRRGAELPRHELRTFASTLANQGARAKDVARLHIDAMRALSSELTLPEERRYASDARLALIEILGTLVDAYRVLAKHVETP